MKEIALTQGQVALVDDCDYEYINQWKWCARWSKETKSFYALRGVLKNGKVTTILMHRTIMGIEESSIKIDHINHNTLLNTRSNLRIADSSQSSSNRRSFKNSSSKYNGVSYDKSAKKWRAQIQKNGIKFNLGRFNSEYDAANRYDLAALEIHGEFAFLNFEKC